MGELVTKRVRNNVYLKGFILPGGTRTTSFWRAKKAFKAGKCVQMNVHVMGYGDLKSSDIVKFAWHNGHHYVETNKHIYRIIGRVHAKRIKQVMVIVPDEEKALTSKNKDDMFKLSEYLKKGYNLHACITRKDGGFSTTSRIVNVDVFWKRLITESGSVYCW